MEKILHGLMSTTTLKHEEKTKVVRMIEQSGRQPHQNSEVKSLLTAAIPYWLSTETSLDDAEMCKTLFSAWSINNVLVMFRTLSSELLGILNVLGGRMDMLALCDLIETSLQICNDTINSHNLDDHAMKSAYLEFTNVVKSEVVVMLVAQSSDVRNLSLLATFLLAHQEVVPWDTPRPVLQVLVNQLSKPVTDVDVKQPQEFIHQVNLVARLIKKLWCQSPTKKLAVMDSLQLLFASVSASKELDSVSVGLSTVLQSIPEVCVALALL